MEYDLPLLLSRSNRPDYVLRLMHANAEAKSRSSEVAVLSSHLNLLFSFSISFLILSKNGSDSASPSNCDTCRVIHTVRSNLPLVLEPRRLFPRPEIRNIDVLI